jgi:DNA primase
VVQGFNVRVVRPPYEGKDPADVIAENADEWKKAVLNTKSIMEYYFENAFAGNNAETPEGKKAIAKILLPSIKRFDNQVEQSFWLQKLARDLEAREEDLRLEMKKIKEAETEPAGGSAAPNEAVRTRNELLEERLLVLILKYAKNKESVEDGYLDFFSPKVREIFSALKDKGEDFGSSLAAETKTYCDVIFLRSEIEAVDEVEARRETDFILKEIKKTKLKTDLEVISRKLKKAENSGDPKTVEDLKKEYNALSKSISGLEKNSQG